ncbi:L-amino acid N-acyltransferase YncA [Nocardioides sp. J9]|uniref:GNAT family N-acetyltransferase n=1 Tax=unclassified Nocardioides TaxID=2615069 RepID=UPI00048A7B6E|nr:MULTISPECIES: GNAT family N-acetyltransferase [unclassified Nocardioides]TWG91191.1 L-amino acid N-acyltransferase YncA [Nocardioides sp. J9]
MADLPVLPTGIRAAEPRDVPDVLRLVRALAEYEREPDAVETTEEDLHRWVFGDDPVASVLVAESAGEVVGMALWFRTFSTWTGTPGLYLEDLFVDPAARGSGLGKALLAALARIAVHRGYRRVEWAVLDWNTPSIEFYEALGAGPMSEWSTYRLTGDALTALATY